MASNHEVNLPHQQLQTKKINEEWYLSHFNVWGDKLKHTL